MKDYSYIGVIEDLIDEERFVVRSKDYSISAENIVEITVRGKALLGKVLHAAYLPIGSEEEAMLAEFGKIYIVDKIYRLAWNYEEEATKNGN